MFKVNNLVLLCIFIYTTNFLITGCSRTKKENGQNIVTFNLRSEGKTIDPTLQTSESSSKVDGMCMEGLVSLGKNSGEIIPGTSDKWTVSKDGKIWIFHLRKNAKWSNGKTVTANDFFFAFKRALTPITAAQYSYLLYGIENAEEYNLGKIKDFSKVGIKVINEFTFKIILKYGIPYFKQILTMPICFPINEQFYNKMNDEFALDADKMLYNGPYIIRKWIPNGKYEFAKNPSYWNKDQININRVDFILVNNYNTAANMYKTHELDMTLITGDQLPQFNSDKDLHKVNAGGIWYLQFNLHNKYFKNKKIRQAVSYAINRKVLCKNIRKDGSQPARSFVPPGISGGIINGKKVTFYKRFGETYFKDNTKKAKELYIEGLKELGLQGNIKVKLLLGTQDVSIRDGQFIQQELHSKLGINVELEPSTFQGRLHKMDRQNYDFVYAGWSPDFNDPINLLDMWVTDGGNNRTGFSNQQYDEYIHIAQTNPNNNKRMEALSKAQKILMEEMPVAPLYFPIRLWLIRDWLKNVVLRSAGIELSFKWAFIKDDNQL